MLLVSRSLATVPQDNAKSVPCDMGASASQDMGGIFFSMGAYVPLVSSAHSLLPSIDDPPSQFPI